MKISIITVCFNAKDTIEDTLLSVFNQTYANIELIVVDGVSNDGTLEIINKYKSKIAHFMSESDKGIYDAMNKGLKLATGDFIIFLNANDIFYNNEVLISVVKALNKNPEIKILFGDVKCISEDKKNAQILTYKNIQTDFSLALNNICHQVIFYHKSLFEKFGGYCLDYKICSDWDFNIKCLVQNKTAALYLQLPIAIYQQGGFSSNAIEICKKERKDIRKKYYSKISFFISINNFLSKHFLTPYKWIGNRLLIKKIIGLCTSHDKYKLNLIIFKAIRK